MHLTAIAATWVLLICIQRKDFYLNKIFDKEERKFFQWKDWKRSCLTDATITNSKLQQQEKILHSFFRHSSHKPDINKIIPCWCCLKIALENVCMVDQSTHAVSDSFIMCIKKKNYRRMCSVVWLGEKRFLNFSTFSLWGCDGGFQFNFVTMSLQ